MSKASREPWQLSPQNRFLLLLLLPLNLLTLVTELAAWFIGLSAVVVAWQWAIFKEKVGPAKSWMKSLLAVAGCILLIVTGKSLGLLAAMIHLLCLSYILKPLEIKKRKDFYQLFILGLLITSTAFIFHQSIYFAGALLILLTLNLVLLFGLFKSNMPYKLLATQAGKFMLQSLPLAIALFVLFPKISPFWQVPQAQGAQTGLSDSLTIGDISKLALSNELAFRVEFEQQVPAYPELYWRAMVLEHFDGKSWQKRFSRLRDIKRFSQVPNDRFSDLSNESNVVNYQVILEPSFQPWMYVLDVGQLQSDARDSNILALDDYTLYSQRKITQPISYKVASVLSSDLDLYPSVNRLRHNLLIDGLSNPKLLEYGRRLRQEKRDAQQIIDQVLLDYRTNNFRYTLEPPAIPDNSLDTFFFDTKSGFCEHYASSFTYLMRAAGIPARIVLGYMGGNFNRQGKYFRVLQREAHAWSEVWLKGRGWIRVDPTAAVDPSRVNLGFSQQLLEEQQNLGSFSFEQWVSGGVAEQLKLYIDLLDYQWTKLVINYSSQQQYQLLKAWFGDYFRFGAVVTIFATLFFVVAVFFTVKYFNVLKNKRANPYLNCYQQMYDYLEKQGVEIEHSESNVQLILRVKQLDKAVAKDIAVIIKTFNQYMYSNNANQVSVEKMKSALGRIRKVPLKASGV